LDPDYGKKYRALYENHWWWRAREDILVDELAALLRKESGILILDVGCGDALFFDRLRRFGDVEGIESDCGLVNPNGPDRARITVAPFDTSFQPGKTYDLILMLDVLEHLDTPEDALRHGLSLLKPGGLIVITVPAFKFLWTNHDSLNKHRTRFTKTSFARLAKSSGMSIQGMRYFFVWLAVAKLIARLKEILIHSQPEIPDIPSPFVNGLLYRFSRAEERLSRKLSPPFGSSLLAVGARSPERS
jgi:SAM-dependent methyltransferase